MIAGEKQSKINNIDLKIEWSKINTHYHGTAY